MITIPYVVNRYVAPFLWGMLMAAAAASSDTVSIMILLTLGGVAAFFSMPRNEALIERLFGAIG